MMTSGIFRSDVEETVYGTTPDDHHVMSDKVQTLAATIYQEFERMIKKYDEDVVKELMPLVVGILESLDIACTDKQEREVDLELLRDDNEQLLTQYEREKQLRRSAEQKYLEVEDNIEAEHNDLTSKVESLEYIVRMLELKSRNSADHVSRLEEKEIEMKKEYSKLHDRYTELFKAHMDYMERAKLLMGADYISDLSPTVRLVKGGGLDLPLGKPYNIIMGASGECSTVTPKPIAEYELSTSADGANETLQSEIDSQHKQNISSETPTDDHSSGRKDAQTGTCQTNCDGATQNVTQDTHHTSPVDHLTLKTHEPDIIPTSEVTSHNLNNNVESKEIHAKQLDNILFNNFNDSFMPVTLEHSLSHDSEKNDLEPVAPTQIVSNPSESIEIPRSKNVNIFGESLGDSIEFSVKFPSRSISHEFNKQSASNNVNIGKESLFYEMNSENLGDIDLAPDITGKEVCPGDYASSDEDCDNSSKDTHANEPFFGVGKEVENLILENNELLATKNALNIVKDDLINKVDDLMGEQEILREEINSLQLVKTRLQQRITQLEEDLKKTKEELEKKNAPPSGEDEDDVPMAQRKRFTRVEMARVLMERNQYKERLMELQEAVRWTELIRASREHPEQTDLAPKKNKTMWGLFGGLFSSSNKPSKKPSSPAKVKFSAPTSDVRPVGDPNKKSRSAYNLGEKAKAYDFLQEDVKSEQLKKEKERSRREQYKQVRAHVKKEDGRLQAYGWSLPARMQPIVRDEDSKSRVTVPVPVYCRPLMGNETGLTIWCAAGVNLAGGKTQDGGSVVGASVFYKDDSSLSVPPPKDNVDKLDKELQDYTKSVEEEEDGSCMSSLTWICSSTTVHSQVTIIDANNPGDILDSFLIATPHILSMASVPGALESDYHNVIEPLKTDGLAPPNSSNKTPPAKGDTGIESIKFLRCTAGSSTDDLEAEEREEEEVKNMSADQSLHHQVSVEKDFEFVEREVNPVILNAFGSPTSSGATTPVSTPDRRLVRDDDNALIRDGISDFSSPSDIQNEEAEKMTSVQPTMWLGCQSGSVFVHSSVKQWKRRLHSVKLRGAVLTIIHVKGRVFVGLSVGSLAIFHRAEDGQWDLRNYHLVELGCPSQSIRCMSVVANSAVWCGYRNVIHVIDPRSISITKTFDAHPRRESQVRHMAWVGEGVWVSIRLDSTLRLYHAHTHEHLQDVDIEPYVSKMLGTGKLGFSFVRITAMTIACKRLWIGTGNGVVISVLLSESNKKTMTSSLPGRPGSVVRVYSDNKNDTVTPGSFIPYCHMSQAQLSFHGHRDAVKFFVTLPGNQSKGYSAASDSSSSLPSAPSKDYVLKSTKLVISGGEGYVDFRVGDEDDDENSLPVSVFDQMERNEARIKAERSYLIVWQVSV